MVNGIAWSLPMDPSSTGRGVVEPHPLDARAPVVHHALEGRRHFSQSSVRCVQTISGDLNVRFVDLHAEITSMVEQSHLGSSSATNERVEHEIAWVTPRND